MLVWIKLLHTVVWAILAGSILALPVLAVLEHFVAAAAIIAAILLEGVVLLVNDGACPLTRVARNYSDDPADNFDIFLPAWLARHNKLIFTGLFVVGLVVTLGSWWAR